MDIDFLDHELEQWGTPPELRVCQGLHFSASYSDRFVSAPGERERMSGATRGATADLDALLHSPDTEFAAFRALDSPRVVGWLFSRRVDALGNCRLSDDWHAWMDRHPRAATHGLFELLFDGGDVPTHQRAYAKRDWERWFAARALTELVCMGHAATIRASTTDAIAAAVEHLISEQAQLWWPFGPVLQMEDWELMLPPVTANWLRVAKLAPLRDQHEVSWGDQRLSTLGLLLALSHDRVPHPGIVAVREVLETVSLDEWAWQIFEAWDPRSPNHAYALRLLCFLGSDALMDRYARWISATRSSRWEHVQTLAMSRRASVPWLLNELCEGAPRVELRNAAKHQLGIVAASEGYEELTKYLRQLDPPTTAHAVTLIERDMLEERAWSREQLRQSMQREAWRSVVSSEGRLMDAETAMADADGPLLVVHPATMTPADIATWSTRLDPSTQPCPQLGRAIIRPPDDPARWDDAVRSNEGRMAPNDALIALTQRRWLADESRKNPEFFDRTCTVGLLQIQMRRPVRRSRPDERTRIEHVCLWDRHRAASFAGLTRAEMSEVLTDLATLGGP
jgi:hypothetical protein